MEDEIRKTGDGERVEEASETSEGSENELEDMIPEDLIPSNAVDISQDKCGKLWKKVICKGKDRVVVKESMIAQFRFVACLATDPNKNIIDSSSFYQDDTEPMEVTVGEGDVIRAIDDGIRAMTRKGERSLFIAHFDYAYGRCSENFPETSNIPNKSFIHFEIELVDAFFSINPTPGKEPDHIVREIMLEISKASKNSHQVTTNSIVYAKLEGQYKGSVFLQKIILPLEPSSLRWGMNQESEAGKMLPTGLALAVRCLALEDGIEGWVTLKGASAYGDDFEGKVVIDGRYKKCVVPKGDEVKFFVSIDEVDEKLYQFFAPLSMKVELYLRLLRRAKFLIEKRSYEAAAAKLNSLVMHLFVMDPREFFMIVSDEYEKTLNLTSYVLCALYGKLYGKLDEKLFGAKDAVKFWDRAIELRRTQKRENVNKLLIANAYFERALLQWNLKEYELALDDLKSSMILHKAFSLTEIAEHEYETAAFLGILDVNDLERGERAAKKIKHLIKQTEAKIKAQKQKEKRSFVLKYYPPK